MIDLNEQREHEDYCITVIVKLTRGPPSPITIVERLSVSIDISKPIISIVKKEDYHIKEKH